MNIQRLFVAVGLASLVMTPLAAQAGERASAVKLVSKSELTRKTLPIKAKKRAIAGVSTGAAVAATVATVVVVAIVADGNGSNQSAGASS